uniref:Alpha-methylacyl-CoA racemase n=1 Tax=Aceria tosichella TaxID=561515 RepID=A0A6G1S960_9ACAR
MALKGLKVIEIAGLAPAPFCGMIFSDFGANVIRIERPGQPPLDSLIRGKRTAAIDLKHDSGKGIFRKLCTNADILIEPFRPGVMERLGLGPDHLMSLNKGLIYARLSGFGQTGPYTKKAGHDINYLALSGVLSLFCSNSKPVPPINMLADFAGGGMTCALGILISLIERSRSGLGQVVDVSMVEGVRYVSTYLWHTQKPDVPARNFIWPKQGQKEANLLDGGAHFYTVYETKDKRWISVGAIEPQFYSALLEVLQLDEKEYPQFDLNRWPEFKTRLAEVFAKRTLDEWTRLFRDADACVEPIIEYHEAEKVAESLSRPYFNTDGTPKPAPLLSRTPGEPNMRDPQQNEHTAEILLEHGFTQDQIKQWSGEQVIDCQIESKL